jgi:hypothetical protein
MTYTSLSSFSTPSYCMICLPDWPIASAADPPADTTPVDSDILLHPVTTTRVCP